MNSMISRCLSAVGDVGGGVDALKDRGPKTDDRVGWFNADEFLGRLKRVNIFCGGFGSGKTEVAVNFSLRMRELGRRVSIADLDIVNLYFRSREVRDQLRGQGIEVLVPGGALANADLPIIIPEIKGAIEGQSSKPESRMTIETRSSNDGGRSGANHQDTKTPRGQSANDKGPGTEDEGTSGREPDSPESRIQNAESRAADKGRPVVVLDLGGDPAGAKVMASIAEGMRPEDYSGLFVLNSRRPFTATVEAAKRMMDGISSAARIDVNRIVVNSHLIDETTPAVIEEGIALGEELSRATGATMAFVAVQPEMLGRFDAAGCRYPVMVLERLMLKPWEPAHRPAEANTANWLGKYKIQ